MNEMALRFGFVVERLRAHVDVFRGLTTGVGEEQARWRPAPDQWSIVEVVTHLADEETEDFRARLDIALHRPTETWAPIDPVGWAIERGYREADLTESIDRFVDERLASLRWLESLDAPDWSTQSTHPSGTAMSAGELLTSWLAHDQIHIRQLNRLHRQYLEGVASPFDPGYAGKW